MSRTEVVLLGAFPPPVGGAAKNNAIMLETLMSLGVPTRKLDISASKLSHTRTLWFHFERISRNAAVSLQLLKIDPKALLYVVPDAGLGAWYTLSHLFVASKRVEEIILHHRSCRYIEHESSPIRRISALTGAELIHVFLTAGMASDFQQRYGKCRQLVVSNARYVLDEASRPLATRHPGPVRLGHLSNLCREKGFFVVADTFEALASTLPNCELLLAGPMIEAGVEERLDELKAKFGDRVQHLGPVSGEEKLDFYRSIDLFLFPSQFPQEAAPNVIYEARAAGVPCLTTDRGRMREILSDGFSAVCSRDEDFVVFAKDYFAHQDFSDEAIFARKSSVKALQLAEAEESCRQNDALMQLLTRGDAMKAGLS